MLKRPPISDKTRTVRLPVEFYERELTTNGKLRKTIYPKPRLPQIIFKKPPLCFAKCMCRLKTVIPENHAYRRELFGD